jgi:hypothetical protein
MKIKYFILVSIAVIANGCGRQAPCDEHGNPVFNSVSLVGLTLPNCSVDAYYYTLSNNIENRASSAFISESPSAVDALQFAVSRPSYFFIVHSNRNVMCNVMLDEVGRANHPGHKFIFTIITEPGKPATRVFLPYTAPLTTHRAMELIEGAWDKTARITGPTNAPLLVFGGSTNGIVPFSTIIDDLVKLIRQKNLARY